VPTELTRWRTVGFLSVGSVLDLLGQSSYCGSLARASAGELQFHLLVPLALAFTSLLLIGLMEMLPDRRLAFLAIGAMALACGIVCCTAIKM
jgi:hypothetical protein